MCQPGTTRAEEKASKSAGERLPDVLSHPAHGAVTVPRDLTHGPPGAGVLPERPPPTHMGAAIPTHGRARRGRKIQPEALREKASRHPTLHGVPLDRGGQRRRKHSPCTLWQASAEP